MRKKIFRGILILLLILVIAYFNLIVYGIRQGIGQMNILWNTQSPEEFLEKSAYPDSVKTYFKTKLALIKDIKRFAVDSLGLEDNGNYERIFDQQGKPLLWAVTASQAYALEPYTWNYGPFGRMPYKGYFDSTLAYGLVKELEAKDLDVDIYNPAAWSTLGWFRDPILSDMLYWSEGGLASLIIHEMTHGTIWIKGNIDYNENLADFIGDEGAKIYLTQKYGKDSEQYQYYTTAPADGSKFYQHILRGAEKLDSLYQGFSENYPEKKKKADKTALITEIVQSLDTVTFQNPARYKSVFEDGLPNNAFFMAYRRYRGKQENLNNDYETKFKGNLRKYIAYLKTQHPTF